MKLLIILVMVGISFSTCAQINQADVNDRLNSEIAKYKRMKTTGIVLICVGGLAAGVGISKQAASVSTLTIEPGAILLGVSGLAILGVGIHFTAKGAKKQHQLESLLTRINITPTSQGLSLSYTF